MKPIFSKSPSLGIRLILAVIVAIVLIVMDGRSKDLSKARGVLESAVENVYFLANSPHSILDTVSDTLVNKSNLLAENRALKAQLLNQKADLLLLDQLKVENQRLRLLLNSPLRTDEYKKIAEVLTAESDAYRQQVVINQGTKDGAYVGQPVIDEKGVVGQIIVAGRNTSRVLLISDSSHSTPLQVLRNDVRVIASGTGRTEELTLDNVPGTLDIKEGDLLVTSGLGGRFPEGYPVAKVTTISKSKKQYFATVKVKPLASLDKLRYVLLLWPTNDEMRRAGSITPDEVREAVKQRLSSKNEEKPQAKEKVEDEPQDIPKDFEEDDKPKFFLNDLQPNKLEREGKKIKQQKGISGAKDGQ